MNKATILLIAKNDDGPTAFSNHITSNNEWETRVAHNTEEAIEIFHQQDFDLVLITTEIGETEQRKLQKIFNWQNPAAVILQDDGTKIFTNDDIKNALDKRSKENKPSFSFVDDALKNAGLHITIQ